MVVRIKFLCIHKSASLTVSSSGYHSSTAGHACECTKVTLRVCHAQLAGKRGQFEYQSPAQFCTIHADKLVLAFHWYFYPG